MPLFFGVIMMISGLHLCSLLLFFYKTQLVFFDHSWLSKCLNCAWQLQWFLSSIPNLEHAVFFLLRLYLLCVDYLALLILNSTAYLSYYIQSNSEVFQWLVSCLLFPLFSSVNCHLRPLPLLNSLSSLLLLKMNECIFRNNVIDCFLCQNEIPILTLSFLAVDQASV